MSVHWLGDFVFVESGLGVRIKFDLTNTVYLTVTAEHLAATRGLCGVYNNNADGTRSVADLLDKVISESPCIIHKVQGLFQSL